MHTGQRAFCIQTDAFQLSATYEPSHIRLQVLDKKSSHLKTGLFYDSNLPEQVKEECEAVGDLYQFLSNKSPQEIQVNESCLKFKVVHIKKERWYSLAIEEQPSNGLCEAERSPPFLQRQDEERQGQLRCGLELENRRLLAENDLLKSEVGRLRMQNIDLQFRPAQSRTLQLIGNDFSPSAQRTSPIKNPNPENFQEQVKSRELHLAPHSSCRTQAHYRVDNNLVTKLTSDASLLFFSEGIRRTEKAHFSVSLETEMENNWIIVGLISAEHFRKNYCYFEKNCICFSGSMGIVFNELEVVDIGVSLRRGDRIKMQLNRERGVAEWLINGQLVCAHRMKLPCDQQLFPYLMLAQGNECVRINVPE